MPETEAPVLPDLLVPGLVLVFCGTAPSRRSAAEHAYYAHPGNYFWRALHESGLTPRRYLPTEYPRLLQLGIGLTDLAKRHSGNDAELPADAFDIPALVTRVEHFAPAWLAFTSKNAARATLGKTTRYGAQDASIGTTRVFVLPSPSGQARGHWDLAPWCELARIVHATHPAG